MANAAIDYQYVYPFASELVAVSAGRQLRLATSGGQEVHPHFFKGKFIHARVSTDLLLAVSLVSRSRFYSPTELRERLAAAADPVVTSGGDKLRFESFSLCCGIYARADFNPDSIDGDWVGRGTTNVDFNPPMRAALSGILDKEDVGLNVGAEGVELEHSGGVAVEKKVRLPVRWLKGFVEVQAYQSKMTQRLEVDAAEARRFIAALPKQEIWNKGTLSYIVPTGKILRLSQREAKDAIPVGAPGRLKILEPLLRHATKLTIYAGQDEVSAWEIAVPGATLQVVVSPDAARGFSGEGQALTHLADQNGLDVINKVRAALQWQAKVDPGELSQRVQADEKSVQAALSMLGARGLVGFDVAEGKYFHREMPFDLEVVEELQPRLLAARELVESGKVNITKRSQTEVEGYVQGTETEHHAVVSDERALCTCRWFSKYQGVRGPCKHILALQLKAES